MLGFYNYTVLLTYLGILVSFVGITFVINGDIHTALICLMISGLCDMFDGKIASTKTRTIQEKRFGIQIDSLSDLICFGCLPAVTIYICAEKSRFSLCAAAFYLLCALVRLAYFNVDEEERQGVTEESRKVYLGLPVTTTALVIPGIIRLNRKFIWPLQILGPAFLLGIGIAFISPFPIKKPGWKGKMAILLLGMAEFLLLIMR